MGYAETVMRLKDSDSDTELFVEGHEGDSDDGAVLEFQVRVVSGQKVDGWVRLRLTHARALLEWMQDHINEIDEARQAETDDEDAGL